MKPIAKKIWEEPAAFIGLLTSILLAVLNLLTDNEWDVETIVGILAPLASSLGIRQAVMPTAKAEEMVRKAAAHEPLGPGHTLPTREPL